MKIVRFKEHVVVCFEEKEWHIWSHDVIGWSDKLSEAVKKINDSNGRECNQEVIRKLLYSMYVEAANFRFREKKEEEDYDDE